MSFSDVEHFATMVTGCEAITAGDRSSGDARYAFAVLKLHTTDFGSHAGQEGFLDQVKAGAAKTGEFIKKLFEAIKKWFASVFQSTKSKFTNFMKGGDEEKRKRVRGILLPKIEALKTAAGHLPEGVSAKGFTEAADKAITAINGTEAGPFVTGVNGLLDAVNKVSDEFEKYCSKLLPRKSGDMHAPYEKAVKEYKAWAEKAHSLTGALEGLWSTGKKD